MAKQRSEKSRYKSMYCEGYCTASQYLVEFICTSKARTEGKELPLRFWQLEEWAKFFRSQTNTANKLLKKYSDKAILAVLKNPKNGKTFSLRAPWLEPQFAEEHNKLLMQEKEMLRAAEEKKGREVDVVIGTNDRPSRASGRLGKLSSLDNI